MIFQFRRAARPHNEQPRRVAWLRRTQRDALRREFEVEQVGTHGKDRLSATRSQEDNNSRAAPSWLPIPDYWSLISAFTILSGLITGSPRLILSTFSMPEVT